MDDITRPLILLPEPPESLPFTSKSSSVTGPFYPARDRIAHGQWLQNQFEGIWQQASSHREERIAASVPAKNGVYVQFAGQPGSPLKVQSLEDTRSGIRLLNVHEKVVSGQVVKFATVYIPSEKRGVFLKKFREYTLENTPGGQPKNQDLASGIEQMRLALLDSFWVDPTDLMPRDQPVWCEVWLRLIQHENSDSILTPFFSICENFGVQYKNQKISFPERMVTLICANQQQLGELIESFGFIAEIRRAQEPESFWTSLYNSEQAEWVEDVLSRLVINTSSNVYISILDTGVNMGHPLLTPLLSDQDCHTVMPEWHLNDHQGHGTLMAGICAYGDIKSTLESNNPVEVLSLLESIKILPDQDENDPDLYGYITSQGIYLAEIQNPVAKRIICMAVTSSFQTDKGRPSSWSAAIDALSSGATDDQRRLFIISAGNVRNPDDYKNYPESNLQLSVESPAQSWNALTVGAYTVKRIVNDDQYIGYSLLAPEGSLSPFSTTSLSWETKTWPNKPDVIFEGGNLLKSEQGEIHWHDDLSELTTFYQQFRRHFSTINGTSLATAKASWMAASIQFYYPNYWPETIRGLIVHSAEWPDELLSQFGLDRNRKSDVAQILRIAGYGLPNLKKAIQCASNSLTLIAQNSIQPFIKDGSSYKTNQMHLYKLPWPVEELLGLGAIQVKLRITLSFFIEPGPGEIGWKDRYRYASHGLRFDLNNTNETEPDFIRRLNAAAISVEDESVSTGGTSGSERWQIGINNRKQGSLHSDIWSGNAADLALCNFIGIYPIIGWWRERHNQDCCNKQTRYSLIVSLEVPEQEIDIYTTVRNMIAIPIEITV
jgi:hypothetical protein